jgi:hypothetical protein
VPPAALPEPEVAVPAAPEATTADEAPVAEATDAPEGGEA